MLDRQVESGLNVFHPTIARWFTESLGTPTDVQARAWPRIAAGEHLLVSAPTGTGKTLTAFLWALDRLLTGAWEGGQVRVLYVSPLKALNNDVRRNLLSPLAALETAFETAREPYEPVEVMTRSGDTPQSERQRMVRRPPEILITTPESLNILLTSKGGRSILTGLETVIFDEIHAAAGSKRGTHWITAVDRLVPLAGEFQRIALSATVRPLETVARFVGGYEMRPLDDEGREVEYRERPVGIVTSERAKAYDLEVDLGAPQLADATAPGGTVPGTGEAGINEDKEENAWESLAARIVDVVARNRSTLVFANSRRTTERLTRLINERGSTTGNASLAYSHHGSLSRELRTVVERKLKNGELRSIVATNSLELGIDIGSLDEVVMVQTPPTVAAAVQRLGRAGHQVDAVSRGRLYPLFERDLVSAAVVARCVLEGDIEEVRPIEGALDVLAQVILSMVATEAWPLDRLFHTVRSSAPYHRLSRRQFDLVLEMLAGRYADTRVRELAPRVTIDRVEGVVHARPGAAMSVYLSGGTIPDRGYFGLRTVDTMAKLGELDEEFVWERRVGDTFSLGAQNWRVRRITSSDVLVSPAHRSAAMTPFWRADARNRSFFLSERLGTFLETADAHLEEPGGREALLAALTERHALSAEAAAALVDLLERQREATGGSLPHRRHLLVEHADDATDQSGGRRMLLHTGWGGRVNRPFAIALAAAWEEQSDLPLQIEAENDVVQIVLPSPMAIDDLLALVRPDNIESLLRARLQRTGLFGGRFRENAGRALLLPRSDLRRRIPLWLTRERSKKLLESVAGHEDFPVVVETWRTCLQDTFDLEALRQVLDELDRGEIRITECRTLAPSPFAAALVWQQTNRLMYEDDVPEGGGELSRTLLQELVFSSQLRPRLPAQLIDTFQRKLHRTFPGYAPTTIPEVDAWIGERLALPVEEFEALLAARARQVGDATTAELLELVDTEACVVSTAGGGRWISALERLPRVLRGLSLTPEDVELTSITDPGGPVSAEFRSHLEELWQSREDPGEGAGEALRALLAEWLRFYGPIPPRMPVAVFGLEPAAAQRALAALVDDETLVLDRFRRDDDDEELCDAENLERLLRALRAQARPSFQALPLDHLPLLLAERQGLVGRGDGIEGLQDALEGLLLYPAPAGSWESDLLPARLAPYYPAWLDSVLLESDLVWIGCGRERTTFTFAEERELLAEAPIDEDLAGELPPEIDEAFAFGRRRAFEELVRSQDAPAADLAAKLWRAAWRGELSNTTFSVVRQGVLQRFKPAAAAERRPPRPGGRGSRSAVGRRAFDRWKSARPSGGDWFRLDPVAAPEDPLAAEDLERDRARLLLSRYGILFRELLDRELPSFQWSRIFRALRLMELSGEVVAGQFFEGIHGPQFVSRSTWRRLSEGLGQGEVYWVSAIDPAAPSGIALDEWRERWLPRRSSNHLVFEGTRPVVLSRRHAAELDITVRPDHPKLPEYLGFLKVLLTRDAQPRKAIDIETINGEPAKRSAFAGPLGELFSTTREAKSLRLRRRY